MRNRPSAQDPLRVKDNVQNRIRVFHVRGSLPTPSHQDHRWNGPQECPSKGAKPTSAEAAESRLQPTLRWVISSSSRRVHLEL
jgi:hypothetical protein